MSAASTVRRRPPRSRLILIAAIAVLVLLVLLIFVVPALIRAASPPPRPRAAPPASAAGTFRPTDAQWRALTLAQVGAMGFPVEEDTDGQIATDDDVTVQVFPPFSGQVTQVFIKAGDRVAKGQPLASANASEFAQAQTDLSTSSANLQAARVQLATAQANAIRQQALLRINGAATKDVQQSQSDLAAATSAVKSDEGALAAVRGRLQILGYDSAQIDALQSRPAGAAAPGAIIRAPLSGVVTQRQVGPGQYVNATSNGATTPLFTISDLGKVWLTANAREEDADRMRVGLPVRVSVAALPGRSFDARLSYVAPTIDPTTRRLPVRAVVDNPGELLKPAMFANFSIQSAAGETAPAVPSAAVIYEGDTARVWIANPDHTLALRPIKAGRTRSGMVEALSGLAVGDRVVVAGALFIDRAAQPE